VTLTATSFKVLSGAGVVAVCLASSCLVLLDPKPVAAPLKPAVNAAPAAAALTIPPSCGRVTVGNARGGQPAGGTPVQLTPQQQQEVQTILAAPSSQRRTLIKALPAADRLQIQAYIAQQQRRGKGGTGAGGQCGPGGQGSSPAGGSIAPDTVAVSGPVENVTSTYVS
jgi:hypothetical protein